MRISRRGESRRVLKTRSVKKETTSVQNHNHPYLTFERPETERETHEPQEETVEATIVEE
jgi:hypothetical protein